jgi:bifunctional non-homologous end joining protein LigD
MSPSTATAGSSKKKVDGWCILAYKDGERVRLVSHNGRDHTRRFAGIAAAIAKLSPRTLALDGAVAIFDQQLRSRFDWLREPDPDAIVSPPLFIAFDHRLDDASRGDRLLVLPAGRRRP